MTEVVYDDNTIKSSEDSGEAQQATDKAAQDVAEAKSQGQSTAQEIKNLEDELESKKDTEKQKTIVAQKATIDTFNKLYKRNVTLQDIKNDVTANKNTSLVQDYCDFLKIDFNELKEWFDKTYISELKNFDKYKLVKILALLALGGSVIDIFWLQKVLKNNFTCLHSGYLR